MEFRLFDMTGLFTPTAPLSVRGTTAGDVPAPGMELRAPGGLAATVEAVEATALPDGTPAWFLSICTGSRDAQARWTAALSGVRDLELRARGEDRDPAS